jgi:hypothetical protein
LLPCVPACFVFWLSFLLLFRPVVEARGEGVVAVSWDAVYSGEEVFQQLHLQSISRWSLGDHRSMPFFGEVEDFFSGG